LTQTIQHYKTTSVISDKVIAAIPCFNNQKFIGDVISRARRYVDEVIVIDDGSIDATAETARKAGAIVVSHGHNKGYGEAIRSCFEIAKAKNADILVTLDGDGQHNPDEIPRLVTPILQDKADVVIGSRVLKDWKSVPGYRRFGIDFINLLWNTGSNLKVSDTQSGFRAYGKSIIEELCLSSKGMSVSIEILGKIRKMNPIITETPISCSYDNNNSSFSLKALWHGFSVACSVLMIRLKHSL
jgi:glycosyltransferase involved in cell wall biosynthesis